MSEQIEMNHLPNALRAAVQAEMENLNRYNRSRSEIISTTFTEINPPEGLGPHQIIYKVILLQLNCFVVMEQVSFDGVDLGVSKTMLTIGSVKEIIERSPAWAGLK